MYSGIYWILQKYHIHRAAYHGGDLTGVCIRKLMSSAKEIMNEVKEYLLATKSPSCLLSDANIADLCNDISVLLLCWDGALSKLHTNNPDEEDCLEAQEYIDKAVELMRKLGLSITIKVHGSQTHLVQQMRITMGGLFKFDESWGEHYHQVGSAYDNRLRNQPSELKKAEIRAGNLRRENQAETKAAGEKLNALKRGPREMTVRATNADKKFKREKRDGALK